MKALLFFVAITAAACGSKNPPPTPTPGDGTTEPTDPPAGAACIKGGCSGTLCVEEGQDAVTTCEWRPEYACYQNATCERQPDGACGWTQTDELTACLASPPAEGEGAATPPQ